MIHHKSQKEIAIMRKGGQLLADVLWQVMTAIKPGVSELELDRLAEKLILEKGGEVSFKRVPGYKHTICVSTNDVVVHGIPTEYRFKEGDVVGVDCGVFYEGFHTDMAETIKIRNSKFEIRNSDDEVDRFLSIGKKALGEAIKQARQGNRVGHISKTIQDIVEGEGKYSIVRTLVGHGVGKELHEDPEVPGFLRKTIEKTPELTVGMTIAVEIIYNMGGKEVVFKNDDGWTIETKDKSLAGLFERTIAITQGGPIILTD